MLRASFDNKQDLNTDGWLLLGHGSYIACASLLAVESY